VHGVGVAVPVATAIVAAARLSPAGPLVADVRTATMSERDVAFEILVRIPLETALAEEVLFRGVHLALTRHLHSTPWAVTRTSLAFGLWHVLPALESLRRVPAAGHLTASTSRRVLAVATTVGATAAAGAVFAALRLRSGSVLAPVVLHAAVNATALACAYARSSPVGEEVAPAGSSSLSASERTACASTAFGSRPAARS
jgi:membrane protease YdiL (CAAX protease family)